MSSDPAIQHLDFSCAVCGVASGSSLVCPACRPHLSDHQKQKLLRTWHRFIVERAGNQCEDCGHSATFDSGELCGDHVETQGARPDLKYDVSNGVCRCQHCHTKRHTGEISPQPSMKRKTDDQPKKVKKAMCKVTRCLLLPLSNGYCIRHQPKGK